MLGWDEPRKQQERARLDAEAANDPELNTARALVDANQPPAAEVAEVA